MMIIVSDNSATNLLLDRVGGPSRVNATMRELGLPSIVVHRRIVFGEITTGASDDLARVAEISRSMVHEYAMGTSITSRKVSAEGGQVSDRTRQLRDEEQQHLADEAMRASVRLINEHRAKLDQFATQLLRNEVLDRKDIDRIMEGVPRLYRSPGQGLRVVASTAVPPPPPPPPAPPIAGQG